VEKPWKQRRIKEVNKEGEEERKCGLEMRGKWRKSEDLEKDDEVF